jgi:hypothetical protein
MDSSEVRRLVAASWADFAKRAEPWLWSEDDYATRVAQQSVADAARETARAILAGEIDLHWDEQ